MLAAANDVMAAVATAGLVERARFAATPRIDDLGLLWPVLGDKRYTCSVDLALFELP